MKNYKIELNNVNSFIKKTLQNDFGDSKLKKIIEYSLDGGKRLRPIIVQEINKKLNKKFRKQFKKTMI